MVSSPWPFKTFVSTSKELFFQAQYAGGARKSASGILESIPVDDYRPGKHKAPVNKHLYLVNTLRPGYCPLIGLIV